MNDSQKTKGDSATKAFFKEAVLGACAGAVVAAGAITACLYYNLANK